MSPANFGFWPSLNKIKIFEIPFDKGEGAMA